MRVIFPQNVPKQTCDYWLITQNQQTFVLKLISFITAGNKKSESGKLQNNTVNGAM